MDTNIIIYIENFIKSTLDKVKMYLDKESIEAVNHYLNHDEYEMAFEGLFIEIMELTVKPNLDFSEVEKIARKLKLDVESVFDSKFWQKLKVYIGSKTG